MVKRFISPKWRFKIMRKLFQADNNFFSDLSGDPNIAIRVQELIQEYSTVEAQRKQGIKESIKKLEGRALPGIIQSTYTLWKRMLADQSLRDFLKTTINSICEKNDAARLFLMRHGIAKNPFVESRTWLINVLCEMNDANRDNAIEKYLSREKLDAIILKTSPELREFLPLWVKYDYETTYVICHELMIVSLKKKTVTDLKEALIFLGYIVSRPSEKIENAVYDFFKNIGWDTDGYKAIAYRNFMHALEQYPLKITSDNCLYYIDALEKVLAESNHPQKRNKYIEKGFISSIRSSLERNSNLLPTIDIQLYNKSYLVTYWFQAIWSNGSLKKYGNGEYFTQIKNVNVSQHYARELFKQYLLQNIWKPQSTPFWMNELVSNMISEYPSSYSVAENDVHKIGPGQDPIYGPTGDGEITTGGGIQKLNVTRDINEIE